VQKDGAAALAVRNSQQPITAIATAIVGINHIERRTDAAIATLLEREFPARSSKAHPALNAIH
jgi:hypothetical protein